MYPPDFATRIVPEGPAKAGLEDKFRPHFFAGVTTVVGKLLIQCQPDFAMFGEKDYQQLKVVTQLARDLDLPVKIIGVPTVREKDGLAMSSRNAYLSARRARGRAHAASGAGGLRRQDRARRADHARARPRAARRSSARASPSIIWKRGTPRRWPRSRRPSEARSGCWWRRGSSKTRLIDNVRGSRHAHS